MTNYAVIVDNGGGPNLVYHDVEGEVYTFPTMYAKKIPTGTKVIYYRSAETKDHPKGLKRLLKEAHYFATATIGEITPTEEGNLRATIEDFALFKYGVPFRKADGSHWETANGQFWMNGVRETTEEAYNAIVEASNTPPAPPAPTAKKGIGIRSTKTLAVGTENNPFADGKLQLVTAKDGYYLKYIPDGIYYQLIKKTLSSFRIGKLSSMPSKEGRKYMLKHDRAFLGCLELIDHGVLFSGLGDYSQINLKIAL